MTKIRKFSAVIHNVRQDSKSAVDDFVQTIFQPKQVVTSLEPNHSSTSTEGFHIHIFLELQGSGREFKSILNKLIKFSKTILTPEPVPSIGLHGRVELDQMYGNFEQATTYLVNPDKDKICGDDVELIVRPPSKTCTDFKNYMIQFNKDAHTFMYEVDPDTNMRGYIYVSQLITLNQTDKLTFKQRMYYNHLRAPGEKMV